jgi:RNA recognition motif-containing protein
MRTVYFGNLSPLTSDIDLMQLCKPFGEVNWASVVRDKAKNISQRFGFVEMTTSEHAAAAITSLHGSVVRGKLLKVNEAKAKKH